MSALDNSLFIFACRYQKGPNVMKSAGVLTMVAAIFLYCGGVWLRRVLKSLTGI